MRYSLRILPLILLALMAAEARGQRSPLSAALATHPPSMIATGSRSHWITGAVVGFAVGGTATYLLLRTGGSTSLCNRSANQDAIGSGECLGLAALGAVGGAAIGALIGSRFRSKNEPADARAAQVIFAPSGSLGLGVVGRLPLKAGRRRT